MTLLRSSIAAPSTLPQAANGNVNGASSSTLPALIGGAVAAGLVAVGAAYFLLRTAERRNRTKPWNKLRAALKTRLPVGNAVSYTGAAPHIGDGGGSVAAAEQENGDEDDYDDDDNDGSGIGVSMTGVATPSNSDEEGGQHGHVVRPSTQRASDVVQPGSGGVASPFRVSAPSAVQPRHPFLRGTAAASSSPFPGSPSSPVSSPGPLPASQQLRPPSPTDPRGGVPERREPYVATSRPARTSIQQGGVDVAPIGVQLRTGGGGESGVLTATEPRAASSSASSTGGGGGGTSRTNSGSEPSAAAGSSSQPPTDLSEAHLTSALPRPIVVALPSPPTGAGPASPHSASGGGSALLRPFSRRAVQ